MSIKNLVFLFLSFFVLFSVAPETVVAQEKENKNEWRFGAEIYLWGASVGGQTGSGSNIDVDFDDLLKNLELGFMGVIGARKGKWSLFADAIYMDVKDSTNVVAGLKLTGELKAWVVTPAVGYNLLETNRVRFDVLGGARYLYLKTDLQLSSLRATDSNSFWDGIVGLKGHVNLTEKWYLPFYADIGTGQTKLTWQALGGIGYRFKWFALNAGYRYMRYDFDSDEAVDDLTLHGPFAGIKFEF